jgi:predicted membrane-bound dolichyl-phosphate-mannose-protein mannosyltransferase
VAAATFSNSVAFLNPFRLVHTPDIRAERTQLLLKELIAPVYVFNVVHLAFAFCRERRNDKPR